MDSPWGHDSNDSTNLVSLLQWGPREAVPALSPGGRALYESPRLKPGAPRRGGSVGGPRNIIRRPWLIFTPRPYYNRVLLGHRKSAAIYAAGLRRQWQKVDSDSDGASFPDLRRLNLGTGYIKTMRDTDGDGCD